MFCVEPVNTVAPLLPVAVTQRGDPSRCEYSVAPVDFTPCMPSSEWTTTVSTAPACPWTAVSNEPLHSPTADVDYAIVTYDKVE